MADVISREWYHLDPLPLPLVPPMPLPVPDPPLELDDAEVLVSETKPVLPPLDIPLPRPRCPRAPPRLGTPACLCCSASSALRRASSRRRSSSAARRSAACCLCSASFSISARSWDAPFQLGFRIRRWLCSVWESMRVQVFSRVEALVTVRDTVCTRGCELVGLLESKVGHRIPAHVLPCFPWPAPGSR